MTLKHIFIAAAAAIVSLAAQAADYPRPTAISPMTTTEAAFLQSNEPNIQETTALEFFRWAYPKGRVLTAHEVVNNGLDGVKSLWIHCDRAGITQDDLLKFYTVDGMTIADGSNPDADNSNPFAESLTGWAKDGGALYLTGQAAALVNVLGRKTSDAGEKEFVFKSNINGSEILPGNPVKISCRADGANHAIFGSPNFTDQELADYKFIVQQFVPMNDDNNGIWPILGTAGPDPIYYADNNVLWSVPDQAAFNAANNCIMLGTWGHDNGHFADIYGIVEFLPTDEWKGNTITNGIAGCQWAPMLASEAARAEDGVAVNIYADNLKRLTFNSLNYLTKAYNTPLTSGVESVEAAEETGEAEYYTMQGVRVANPGTGLYIRRCGAKAEKVFIQ